MNWVRPQDRKPVNVPWLLFSAVMVLAGMYYVRFEYHRVYDTILYALCAFILGGTVGYLAGRQIRHKHLLPPNKGD